MRRGCLIAFTGIDGSGKTTQAELLVESLKQNGFNVSYVWSRWKPFLLRSLIKRWKSGSAAGDDKLNNDEINIKKKKQRMLSNPIIRWLWLSAFFIDYGLQIFVKIRLRLLKKGLVISDRIFYDSVIDQAINLGKNRDWLLRSLDSFWIRFIFPRPDVILYVDCPADTAFLRKDDAPNIEYLEARRTLYLKLTDKYQWLKVDGALSLEETSTQISNKIYSKIKQLSCQK
jgi:thymidylate kinase